MLAVGSAGLLAAMTTDALAVAGRHAGIRLLGSIEIVQACIVVVATSAIVLTTRDSTNTTSTRAHHGVNR